MFNIKEEIAPKTLKSIIKSLEKRAMGYETEEVIEEYLKNDQSENLVKKKVTKHYIPADIAAAKLLIEISNDLELDDYSALSELELDQKAEELYSSYKELSATKPENNLKGEV